MPNCCTAQPPQLISCLKKHVWPLYFYFIFTFIHLNDQISTEGYLAFYFTFIGLEEGTHPYL